MTDKLTQLSRAIGYFFKDEGILCEALTHSSYKKSGKADYDNERYEFLGDRVLNLVISDYFFDRGENDNEGELTQLLSNCHDGKTLSDMGYKLELQKYLYIDLGQIGRGFKEQRDRILGDAVEALIGGVYKDGGYDAAKKVVLSLFSEVLTEARGKGLKSDKVLLQEYAQKEKLGLPIYEVVERSGPDHNPHFKVEVRVEQIGKAFGEGGSRKEAEERAAGALCETKLQLIKGDQTLVKVV